MRALDLAGPRPLLILGPEPQAPAHALRRILHAKQQGQGLVVIDYQGSLSQHLDTRTKGNLQNAAVLWCNLGQRLRPWALPRWQQGSGLACALTALLTQFAARFASDTPQSVLAACVELAQRLARDGSFGLLSWVRALKRPELTQSLRLAAAEHEALAMFTSRMQWVMGFAGVWGLAEGSNVIDLERAVGQGGTVWIELPRQQLEDAEHAAMAAMVEAVLLNTLLRPVERGARPPPLVLYANPRFTPPSMSLAPTNALHTALFRFDGTKPLPAAARAWWERRSDCWIAGPLNLSNDGKAAAAFTASERERLNTLQADQVWLRGGADGRAVTSQVRPAQAQESLAEGYRRHALATLKLASERQMSSAAAVALADAPASISSPGEALFAKLSDPSSLMTGWFRVKGHNPKSCGVDGITIAQFGRDLAAELNLLSNDLCSGRYRARALRSVHIPKPNGETRELRIACVRDRVVQAAYLQLVEPLFEWRFSPRSFGYRPGRNAQQALAVARSSLRQGRVHAVVADIRKCFDCIDHEVLLRLVGDVMKDAAMLALLRHWLTADVISFGQMLPVELGVPQGESISPLLCNIYLDPLDRRFEQEGLSFVRYADDYLVLCANEAQAQAALALMRDVLDEYLHLALKENKTLVCHMDAGTRFLGFEITTRSVRTPPEKLDDVLERATPHALALADTASDSAARALARRNLDALTTGFRNYYLVDDAPEIVAQLLELDLRLESALPELPADDNLLWSERTRFGQLPDGGDGQALLKRWAANGGLYEGTATPAAKVAEPEVAPATKGPTDETVPWMLHERRLHVLGGPCYLTVNEGSLSVRRARQELAKFNMQDLSLVYLEGRRIAVLTDLLSQLGGAGVTVVVSTGHGAPQAVVNGQAGRGQCRQLQVLRRDDPQILRAGLDMLSAKVANQASVLRYFARYRKRAAPQEHAALCETADGIRGNARKLSDLDTGAAGLRQVAMGYEGQAAARYWQALAALSPKHLAFEGRRTHNATDPLNASINYVYGMLYGEVWRAVVRAGLDPFFGILHGSEKEQGSLIFDMIEEFRAPFGDRVVWGAMGRGLMIQLDDEGLLARDTRRKLARAFHAQWERPVRALGGMLTPAALLEQQVRQLRTCFEGKATYTAFRFRW